MKKNIINRIISNETVETLKNELESFCTACDCSHFGTFYNKVILYILDKVMTEEEKEFLYGEYVIESHLSLYYQDNKVLIDVHDCDTHLIINATDDKEYVFDDLLIGNLISVKPFVLHNPFESNGDKEKKEADKQKLEKTKEVLYSLKID